MAIMEQTRNGRVVRKHRSLVARLSVVALAVLITGAGLAAHGSGSASASALNATGGAYKLAPALMGGGASQPGANPNATLTMNLVNEVTTADPQVESFVNEIGISSKIFAPLLAVNQHLQVAANAATSLNVSPDGRTYTFTIRPGMTYSDGQPVTAQDYAFAIKRACSPVVAGNYSNILFDVVGCQAWRTADTSKVSKSKLREMEQTVSNAIKALDAHTLRIQLLKPAGYFPYVMATWVTYPSRPDLVKAGGANWWKNPKYYIGNGPFKVVSWKPRQQWVLALNESYFRGKPGIKTFIWKEVSSPETALLAYKQGQFDNIALDATLLPQVLGDPTLKQQLHRQVAATTFYIGFDNADKPFNDVRVRQAFAYAMNRQQYINQVANGVGKPAGQFLYPGIAGYQTTFVQTYDPVRAKSLLAQAGYPNGQGFPTLQLRYRNTSAAAKERATFWAQQFKQVLNVNIQPTPTDPAQLQKLLAARSPQLKIYLLGWVQDYPHPQDWLTLVFGNNSSLAPHGWNDPHFNALVNKADKLPIQEATPLYQQADAYLARMAPVAFSYYDEDLELVKPDVKGFVRYPTAAFDITWQPEKIYKTKP
jgi:oligopeptide transport system substrate-binding protein